MAVEVSNIKKDDGSSVNIGDRLICDEYTATILYVGQVPPTKGKWLGCSNCFFKSFFFIVQGHNFIYIINIMHDFGYSLPVCIQFLWFLHQFYKCTLNIYNETLFCLIFYQLLIHDKPFVYDR